ncbi:hypothetical protein ABZT16_27255 [Streptomyces flaveolus]|nr:hypothetical protein [Streptomyces sp. NRRL F-3307]
MRLGTRLQFLVVQTDISGIELAPRRHRLTAYLAGIATNLAFASAFALATLAVDGTPRRILAALALLSLVLGTALCLVFLATVTLPADIALLARPGARLRPGRPVTQRLDSLAVVLALGGIHVLWLRTWWRGRRERQRRC